MMFRPIVKDSTDQSVVIRIVDAGDGTPEQSVEHDTTGASLWYRRDGAVVTAITPAALAAANSAHADGGLEHLDDGYYRLDLPDAAVATGVNGLQVGGAFDGMVVIGCYVPLYNLNPYDGVRAGLTALPNAAADAAGGLPISDAGGLDLDARLDAAVSSRATPTQVNAEVLDVLNVDTFAEPGQGAPAATTTLSAKIGYLFKAWRNRKTQTATQFSLYNDDATTVDHKATTADDGTTGSIGEIASGP